MLLALYKEGSYTDYHGSFCLISTQVRHILDRAARSFLFSISPLNSDLTELISGTQIIDDTISSGGAWTNTTFKPSADKLYRIVPNFRGQGSDTTNANVTSVIVKGSDLLNTSPSCPFVLHGDFNTPTTALGLFYNPTVQVVQVYRGTSFYNTFVYHFVVYELA